MIWAVTAALLSGCALLKPFPPDRKTTERLDMFPREGAPLRAEATIYWNKHQIPYIHVNDDEDLPLALGMVHAHLRLGQMELLRHVFPRQAGGALWPAAGRCRSFPAYPRFR
ncbi:MAG: hypothetical protein HKN69_11070 [Desulfofustis sp.]|nr:hypothetical protein [Desulfofustis sp.]